MKNHIDHRFRERRDDRAVQQMIDRAMAMSPEERTRYLNTLRARRVEYENLAARIRTVLNPNDSPGNVVPFRRIGNEKDGAA